MTEREVDLPGYEDNFDRYVDASEKLEGLVEDQKRYKSGTAEEQDAADDRLRANSFNSLPKNIRPDNKDERTDNNPNGMSEDLYQTGLRIYQTNQVHRRSNNFKSLLGHLHEVERAHKALERLALAEDIREKVSGKDGNILDKFAQYATFKKIADKIDDGLNSDERKIFKSAAQIGFAEKEVEDYKNGSDDERHDREYFDLIRQAAAISISDGNIGDDKLKPYFEVGVKKSEEAYKKALGDDSNKIYKIVGDALKTLAGESADGFNSASEAFNKAYKGKL